MNKHSYKDRKYDVVSYDPSWPSQFVMENSKLFRIMKVNTLLANIHFFPVGHPHNNEMLDLRNYLLVHPEEIKSYSELKNELYLKYSNDYASYRKYKDEYMDGLKKRVLKQKEIATS